MTCVVVSGPAVRGGRRTRRRGDHDPVVFPPVPRPRPLPRVPAAEVGSRRHRHLVGDARQDDAGPPTTEDHARRTARRLPREVKGQPRFGGTTTLVLNPASFWCCCLRNDVASEDN